MKNIKDLYIITVGQIIQGVILLVSIRLSTEFLSPGQMGVLSIVQTVAMFFFALLIVPASTYVQRRILEWKAEGNVLFYSRYFIVCK